jgi:hypothetical protein
MTESCGFILSVRPTLYFLLLSVSIHSEVLKGRKSRLANTRRTTNKGGITHFLTTRVNLHRPKTPRNPVTRKGPVRACDSDADLRLWTLMPFITLPTK